MKKAHKLTSSIGMLLLLISLLGGCTRGKVTDATTGNLLSADVGVNVFPHPSGTLGTSPWQVGWSLSHNVVSQSTGYDGYNYGFDNIADACVPGVGAGLGADRWYRIKTSKNNNAEHDLHVSYQFHPLYSESCTTYSCADSEYVTTTCHSFEDTEVWPKTAGNQLGRFLPDVVPDLRDLKDVEIECVWEEEVDLQIPPVIVSMRLPRSFANAGAAHFQVELPVEGGTCVTRFDCPDGLDCVSGTCEYETGCPTDSCPSGLVCDAGVCALASCSTSNPCQYGPGCILEGLCEPEGLPSSHSEQPCINDGACDPNQECRWNGSYNACFQRECEFDVECPSQYCWTSMGLCLPTPETCDSLSTECTCNLGDTGTCAPGVFQVFHGSSGPWRGEIDAEIEFNDTRNQWEISDLLIHSVYLKNSTCNSTPHQSRDSAWWGDCGVGLNSGVVESESWCLNGDKEFDVEILGAGFGFSLLQSSCDHVHRLSPGYKAVSDHNTSGHFVVLDDRRVNTTFQNLQGLSNKTIWVESIFDPESKTIERSKGNNITRASLTLPSFPGIATVNWANWCDRNIGCDSMGDTCSDYF